MFYVHIVSYFGKQWICSTWYDSYVIYDVSRWVFRLYQFQGISLNHSDKAFYHLALFKVHGPTAS